MGWFKGCVKALAGIHYKGLGGLTLNPLNPKPEVQEGSMLIVSG